MSDWLKIFGRPIAFHRVFVEWTESVPAALMLSQLIYWMDKSESGWIFKTIRDWESETGLKRRDQASARKLLRRCGLIEEKRAGVPAKLYFRVSMKGLSKYGKASRDEPDRLVGTAAPNRLGLPRPTIPETTSETTTPGACGLRGSGLIPSASKIPWADRMATKYADWTIKNRLHSGAKGSTRNGWTPQMLVSWRKSIEELAQQIGSRKEVREMMEWYFVNWKEDYVPRCQTLGVFCKRWCDVVASRKRITQKKRRKNGEDDNEKANPKGYWENDVFIPAEEEV